MVGPSVDLVGLKKYYSLPGGKAVAALDGLTLSIPANAYFIITGPNGCGKTSLLRAIEGSIDLDAGEVRSNSQNYRLVHISQDPASRTFSKLTIAEHFMLAEISRRKASPARRGLNLLRLDDYRRMLVEFKREDLIPFLQRPVSELSGGMRQAVSILCGAIPSDNSNDSGLLLLLDEPLESLDAKNELTCLQLIAQLHKKGATVIMVNHDPLLASKIGENIVYLKTGKIFHIYKKNVGLSSHEEYHIISEKLRELYDLPLRESDDGGNVLA